MKWFYGILMFLIMSLSILFKQVIDDEPESLWSEVNQSLPCTCTEHVFYFYTEEME